jgi:hypothetical protein
VAASGTVIGPRTLPVWRGEPLDVVWAIDVLRGHERLDLVARHPSAETEQLE